MTKRHLKKQQGKLDLQVEIDKGTVGSALALLHEVSDSLTTKEIGDWFELIVLRLLLADPEFEVAEAWLSRDCPPEIGGGEDLGTDLVARTANGRIIAVQCKYRTRGSVPKGDIDSFLADAATKTNYDFLFVATSADLGRNAKKAIKGIDKPCQHIDVRNRASTSLDTGKEREVRTPNKQQATAIRNVLQGLGDGGPHDRGKLIMACGTGKTFTSLRIAEGISGTADGSPLILFAAPSIALVGQARREWLSHAQMPLATIIVCSSKAEGRAPVRKDGPVDIDPSTLACQVTTDPAIISNFMDGDGARAVFCTYHSLHRVAEAQAKHGAPDFSLAIADEAHRTTGKFDEDSKTDFRLILKDSALHADKRLFMTATPRVYTNASKNFVKFDVVDMNDEHLYGDTLHRLSFREAVKADLLCDYRVIVLALNNQMHITESVRQAFKEARDEAEANEDDISPADQVRLFGTCLAINGAVSGTGVETPDSLPRTIAFANNRKVSQWMAKSIGDDRTSNLAARRLRDSGRGKARKINAVHLDAKSGGDRRLAEVRALQDASDAECRMICNVGLFGEGVDIPALDGVVFFHPRRSAIDVMQAVGRVMRKSPRKKLGYVIVPVVVPPKENVIEALQDSKDGYEKIGEVLQALQSTDPSIVDNLSDYVHIAQPDPPKDASKTPSNGEPLPQTEFRFDLSKASDKAALYAYIGEGAGHSGRKDLVAGHMKAAVDAYKDKLDSMELSVPIAEALGLPHTEKDEKENACAIAALLLINAMLLGHRLGRDVEGVGEAIKSLTTLDSPYMPCRHAWLRVLKQDYAPIFRPALAALDVIGGGPAWAPLIRGLASTALDVAEGISDFSYDHAGPLFHKVLGKRGEADGAYYSNNLAALLLAGLAIPKHTERPLRVLDPACGTGTLLMAALDTMKRHALKDNPGLDEAALHRKLVEESIHGLDINHHAAQFAAANLTLGAPDVGFSRMNLAAVRDGVHDGRAYAGSLELLPQGGGQEDWVAVKDISAPLPPIEGLPDAHGSADFNPGGMDVVITNPPFTEVNKRLEKLPDRADKDLMGARFQALQDDLAGTDAAHMVKGARSIEPYFTPLINRLLRKDTGTMAIVLPVTALISPSKQVLARRRYLAAHFHLATVITSHAPSKKGIGINFSHDTDVHESLLVLRRWPEGMLKPPTEYVALTRQPETKAEALELLDAIQRGDVGGWGRRVLWPAGRVADGDWSFANWLDADLAEWALKVRAMDGLADLGDHVLVIGRNPNFNKAFRPVDEAKREKPDALVYSTVSSKLMRTMSSKPTAAVKVRDDAPPAILTAANKPTRTFVSFRTRPGVCRALAIHTPEAALATAYHGLAAKTTDVRHEPAVAAFLNSTFGWLQVLNQRAFTLDYTRLDPVSVRRLRVPPPHSAAIGILAKAHKELKDKEFAQGRDAADCPVRTRLDSLAAQAIGFDEATIHDLRTRIAAEPPVAQGGGGKTKAKRAGCNNTGADK